MSNGPSNQAERERRWFRRSVVIFLSVLLLCLVSSFFQIDRASYSKDGLSIVRLGDGAVQMYRAAAFRRIAPTEWSISGPRWPNMDRIGSFGVPPFTGRSTTYGLPLWPLIVPPVFFMWWMWIRMRRAEDRGHKCHHCGYDLRGLAITTTRCPECGVRRLRPRGEERFRGELP